MGGLMNIVRWLNAIMLIALIWPGAGYSAELRRQPYLLAQHETGITIRWRTDGQVRKASQVRIGLSVNRLDNIFPAEATPSPDGDYIDWEAVVTGLKPSSFYFYGIEADYALIAGGDHRHFFRTAHPETSGEVLRFWCLGDSGANRPRPEADASPFGAGIIPHPVIVRNGFRQFNGNKLLDGILLLGDNAYELGTDREYQSALFNTYSDELTRTPLWPCVGNHDLDTAYEKVFKAKAKAIRDRFSESFPFYYSFKNGPAHFVVLDPWKSWLETTSSPDHKPWKKQLTWLKEDLEDNQSYWTILITHFPLYCDGNYNSDTDTVLVQLREMLIPVIDEYGVDMVLAGHDHTYQRSWLIHNHTGDSKSFDMESHRISSSDGVSEPMVKSTADGKGTVYIVSGNAGGTRPIGNFKHPAMIPLAPGSPNPNGQAVPGSLALEISKKSIQGFHVDYNGKVIDRFQLIKK